MALTPTAAHRGFHLAEDGRLDASKASSAPARNYS